MIRIVAGTAVAHADIEKAVGPEREVAAVVIRERLSISARPPAPFQRRSKREDGSATSGSADRRKRATTVSPAVLVKLTKKRPLDGIGRERQPEQTLLAAGPHRAVRSRNAAGSSRAAANGADPAALLDDELHGRIGGILDEGERRRKTGRVDAAAQRAARRQARPAQRL